ncbi:hypothetical protein [Ferruginibacter sp. HRS2-29]|uniref:hypothetical protein n=1 Tax=Ferruginibacter sp. HRS2-29 TaxID=2487334 RepID=UPI0020CBA0F8|nr:hypothetical protein [Ferruginibacter sp. HRS2-29]MCP9749543.1 hypothetical protein [Ferruginibacter sp. HRS2-29]
MTTITNREEKKLSVTNRAELELAIIELKQKKTEQRAELNQLFHETIEGFKPGNLIRKAFSKVIEPGDTRDMILKTIGGIGAGLLTKGIIGNKSGGMISSFFKKALRVGAGKVFYNNADKLKAYGTAIYHNLFKK